ncbi:MAG: LysM peptidoglycan-binding domain-containing protein [Lachnospiraceae bacterium]
MRRCTRTRRERQIQIRVRLMLGLVACMIIFSAVFVTTSITARADRRESRMKMFTSIEVKGGDTLYEIADRYADEHYPSCNDYVREVVRINCLDNADDIVAGQYILIPYYTDYAYSE